MLFLASLGGLFIISFSGGSNPNAIAGNESVTKFTHNSCIASNGDFTPNNNPTKIVTISPIFVAIKNELPFYVIKYISSLLYCTNNGNKVVIIQNHICCIFATSVPFSPIAIPMLDFLVLVHH